MDQMTTYSKMTASPVDLFDVLKTEIGLKTDCSPFAVKAIAALKSLGVLTQAESVNAANVFLDNLQTLNQGGIKAEDYDKIDFVKRGKTITISARVEAFYRAAARKGYQITDKIIGVPNEDSKTTYFREEFQNGEMILILEDKRINTDRKITAERIANGYFSKYICRFIVVNVKNSMRLMSECEISNDEMLQIANTSEQGIYVSRWVEYKKPNGYTGKKNTTNTSYRKLAKKYDIPFNTIQCRAKKEKWVELRNRYQDNIVTKSVKKAEESSIDYKSDLFDLAYKVAMQLKNMINENTISDLVAMGIKPRDITSAIKDLEDALHIKFISDIKEQEARIAKLRKEVEEEDKNDKKIIVCIKGDADDYSS